MPEGGMQPEEALADERKLGHYEILGKLGQGGGGVVYKARDTRLERLVALKVLSSKRVADEKDRRRFMQEARSASALNHPNIVTIYEIALLDGKHCIAMEYIEGQTLRELTQRIPDVACLIAMFRQMAEGMAAAHAGGIVHRDIKPANVMLRADGYIKIVDFGLARLANNPVSEDETQTELSQPGTIVGTAKYMSPEQVRGEAVESPSDVFSMGLVFYKLATGKHPFHSGPPFRYVRGILTETPIPASKLNPEIPAALDSLILTMLAKEKAGRPAFGAIKSVLASMERLSGGAPAAAAPLARSNSVGREEELSRLRAAFASVSAGSGIMLTVCGDAGMGKTTLAEDFLAGIEAQYGTAWAGRGRCSERLAETDAFAPILESLDTLLRGESGDQVARVMKTVAPTWYVQVSPPISESTEITAKEARTGSHERMRREFVSFFEELSRTRPVVLFLDDVHWADASTCDLLAHLGARMGNIRILILATYRPGAVLAREHPFLPLKFELERRGVCQDVPLSFLSLNDIEKYVAAQFPANLFPPEFTRAVHERTEGNPLFMTEMLRYLRDRRILVEQGGRCLLAQPVGEVRKAIPVGIRSLIRLKIDRFSEEDRRILLCAAVQGLQFDSAVIAQVLSLDPVDVEERLQEMETMHSFVRIVGEREFANRTFSVRYRFVHVFYQNALFSSLTPSRRAAHSLAIAEALASFAGDTSRGIAADLALLFESGRDYASAAQYFLQAARNAVRMFAYPETAVLCERGLRALASLPESRERDARELVFSLILGVSLMATRGYAAPEVEKTHRRSRELCLKLREDRRLLLVLWGLHTCAVNAGDLTAALETALEMRRIAAVLTEPIANAASLHAVGTTLAFMGRVAEARETLESIFAECPANQHTFHGSLYDYVLDPCVTTLSMLARVLALMGYLDQAVAKAAESFELANGLAHPHSLAYAIFWVGWVHHARGEHADACRHLESAMALSRAHGFPLILEWGRMVRGSALTNMGRANEGISEIRKSLDRQRSMRSLLERSYFLTLLAEALGGVGACEEALAACDEALEFAQRTEGRCYEPETHRVRGEVLLGMGDDARLPEAEAEFECALDRAKRAQCRLLELRAAVSYFHLHRRLGDAARGRAPLAEVLAWFSEGANSPVVTDARMLLADR
ncbi:MAG: serine/threonine-protein kinase PknK [Bryobacteraceae bacterium]